MSFFVPNFHAPQLVTGHPFGFQKENRPAFAGYGGPPPHHANAPRFLLNDSAFPPHVPAPQHLIPRDVLEQRARTPCKHFEHHVGWCPYGTQCHFLHDVSRLPSPGSSASPSLASSASSTSSSLRSSPVPSGPYHNATRLNSHRAAFGACLQSVHRVPHHEFTPRTIGGTTYFPIRLGQSRLGYVTPIGVEVFARI